MKILRTYTPSMIAVMKLLKSGTLTVRQAADILECSVKTVQDFKKEHGIEAVYVGTGQNRREKAEANKIRNALLETLARSIIYDNADIQEVSKKNHIPSRTLYRWVTRISEQDKSLDV